MGGKAAGHGVSPGGLIGHRRGGLWLLEPRELPNPCAAAQGYTIM